MLVKVCGLKDEKNISDISNLDIDFMGLIFYKKSKRFVNKDFLVKKNNKKLVGVFVNETIDEIKRISKKYDLDYVQLHGDENVEFCNKVNNFIDVIKVFRISYDFDFNSIDKFYNCCKYFLFDTKSKKFGGTGEKFEWSILKEKKIYKDFFLSGGIDNNDDQIIKNLDLNHLIGIDLNSKFEFEPGKKDVKKLNKFLNKINENI